MSKLLPLRISATLLATCLLAATASAAAPKAKKKTVVEAVSVTLHNRLVAVKKSYRQGEISRSAAWSAFADLYDQGAKMQVQDRISLLETQATLLQEAGYPILAAIYSSQAIKQSPTPIAPDLEAAWTILRRVSAQKPIQNVLEIVADTLDTHGKPVPVFGSEWNYFAGTAAARRGETDKALHFYSSLNVDDRYFFPAKYQQAMLLIDGEKLPEAEVALKAIIYPTSQKVSPLDEKTRNRMLDYAYLGLGRLYYEQQRFEESIRMYRAVSRDGLSFYDALFEQGWAFFMGGYPMHALGAMYSVESPFYKDVFNPESSLLRALVHYWLCRYDSSRNALADFMERYEPEVEKLTDFLDRKHLDAETSYTLFENLVSGVSDESLGVPRAILKTAAEKDSMLLVRDQYAAIVEEKQRLEAKGVFGNRTRVDKPLDYMDRWAGGLRKDVGKHFLVELQEMKKDYDRLYSQAEFLYVELLMSEKDQLLGKELHASNKITHVSSRQAISSWGSKTQAWKDAHNGEYWWDEVGFYIEPVESQCTVPGKSH